LPMGSEVLTRESWESANLSEIVAQAVEPYRSRGEHRIHVGGSPARLPPRMALAMAMALQELATDAVKHGAVSNPTGEVKVHWELTTEAGEYDLHMRWEESGGPSLVADSPKRGFGTRLIERTVKEELGGDLLLAFTPNGFLCELRVPFQEGARRL
jgi:two-component sensor histidine kinase